MGDKYNVLFNRQNKTKLLSEREIHSCFKYILLMQNKNEHFLKNLDYFIKKMCLQTLGEAHMTNYVHTIEKSIMYKYAYV